MKTGAIILLSILLMTGCNQSTKKDNKEKAQVQTFENKVLEKFKKDFLWRLTDASSYEEGNYRFETLKPNGDRVQFLDSSIYMNMTNKHELFGDTIYDGRYFVYHIYRANNKFGAKVTEIIEACYDSHLTLLGNRMDNVSLEQEQKRARFLQKNGIDIKPLEMTN
jgi:hypothetical protein